MKHFGVLITMAAMITMVALCAPVSAEDFAGGSGTPGDPWLVETGEQLQAVDDHLNAHFRQIADINLFGVNFTPIALTSLPDTVIQFRGTYDGDGYVIKYLEVLEPSLDVIALFGKLGPEGILRDVHVRNVNIAGRFCAAGLVGENNGHIEDCSATGTVVGINWSGGLVGDNRITILDSHARVDVTSTGSPGGLVGVHFGSGPPRLERCYASGAVNGGVGGGLVGSVIGASPIVLNCFWDVQATGQATSNGGTGRTTAQMKMQSTFDPPWDFTTLWQIDEGVDYPIHQSTARLLGDLDLNGKVDGADLTMLLGLWGNCGGEPGCAADLDEDLFVGGSDLTLLLGNWTLSAP